MTGRAAGRDPRGRVAAGILAVLLIGSYFVSSGGDGGALPTAFVINAVILVLAFWFPAVRLERPRDLSRQAVPLLVWVLAWTLTWDFMTAGLLPGRAVFQEWWIVYPAGVALFGGLLLLQTIAVRRWARGGTPGAHPTERP